MNKDNKEKFYNIHDFVKVRIKGSGLEEYDHYLRYFESAPHSESNYEIKKSKKYEVRYNQGKIFEFAPYANIATNFLIETLLVGRGLSFVHSAGVEIEGRGFLFPAAGGVGKTSLVSYLRQIPNFKFFGDDFVMLNQAGEMFSYPSDFSIYKFHLKLFPELKNTSYAKFLWRRKYFPFYYFAKKAINFIVKRLFLFSGPILPGWNASYAKVPAEFLIPKSKIGESTKLYAALFLERYKGGEIKKEEASKQELSELIAKILKEEFKYANQYLETLQINDLYAKAKGIISAALSNVKCYKIYLPENLKMEEYFKQMENFIRSI